MANSKNGRNNSKIGNTHATLVRISEDEPYAYYGSEKLNADIAWDIVVGKILTSTYTLKTLACEVETTERFLKQLLQKDFRGLPFRLGAHLLGIHTVLFGDDAPITL